MSLNSTKKNPQFPIWLDEDETDQSDIVRYEEIPTPEKLRRKTLFGVPLQSRLVNPPVNLTDETIQDYINEAISKVEHDLDIYIKPIVTTESIDFNKDFWRQSFAFIQLAHPNIIEVLRIRLKFQQASTIQDGLQHTGGVDDDIDPNSIWLDIPREYIYVRPQEGTVQIVPAYGQSMAGFITSAMSGAQYYALTRIDYTTIPGVVQIKYRCGFEDGKIPALIAQLIEVTAALDILSMIGPLLFPYNSISIAIDGISQGTGNQSVAYFAQRIQELTKKRDELMDSAKGYYLRRHLLGYI